MNIVSRTRIELALGVNVLSLGEVKEKNDKEKGDAQMWNCDELWRWLWRYTHSLTIPRTHGLNEAFPYAPSLLGPERRITKTPIKNLRTSRKWFYWRIDKK